MKKLTKYQRLYTYNWLLNNRYSKGIVIDNCYLLPMRHCQGQCVLAISGGDCTYLLSLIVITQQGTWTRVKLFNFFLSFN